VNRVALRIGLLAIAAHLAVVPAVHAEETRALVPGEVLSLPDAAPTTEPTDGSESTGADTVTLPELPRAPSINGPTLAAMQLALPLFGGLFLRSTLPDDLNSRLVTGSYTIGTEERTYSYTTSDYRGRAALYAAGNSLLLLPSYLALGQLSTGTESLLMTWLMAGFGTLVGYQAGGQPPFSGTLTGEALEDRRIGTALIGAGIGFLTGQVRSAVDVWARADAMQAEHDRVKALRRDLKARMQAQMLDPTDAPVLTEAPVPAVDPEKPLGDLSLVKPPSNGDVALWSLINVAGHVVLPTVGFAASALATSALGPISFPLWFISGASIPGASGLTHFARGDWSGGLSRTLLAVPVVVLGGGLGALGGAALGSDSYARLTGAAVGMLIGSLTSLVWWDVESARDGLVRDYRRKIEAGAQPEDPEAGQQAPATLPSASDPAAPRFRTGPNWR